MIGEHNHLFGSENRLFVNIALGCMSNCDYCYLNDIGLSKGYIDNSVEASSLIEVLECRKDDLWHPEETIISFGCYSDPWTKDYREETIKLLNYFLSNKNKITLSTKQYISPKDLIKIKKDSDRSNPVFLVSIPVIKNLTSYERGTSSIRMRRLSIENLIKHGFSVALYIKPVIPSLTIKSLGEYCKLISDYNLPVVLGRQFSPNGSGNKAVISKTMEMFEGHDDDYVFIKNILSIIGEVYEHSYEVI